MKTIKEYERRGRECEKLADTAESEDHRLLLLGMSATWRMMAENRKQLLWKRAQEEAKKDGLSSRKGRG